MYKENKTHEREKHYCCQYDGGIDECICSINVCPSIDDDSIGMIFTPDGGSEPPNDIFPFKSSDFSSSRRRKHAALGLRFRSNRKFRKSTFENLSFSYLELAVREL